MWWTVRMKSRWALRMMPPIYSAKVVGLDPPTDVAILKIEAKDLPAATLGDSDQLEVGDVVLAVDDRLGIGQTVTKGNHQCAGPQHH